MENEVIFHPQARVELISALEWYEKQQAGQSRRFWVEYSNCVEGIRNNPLLFPVVYGKYRRLVMRNFPYNIVFQFKQPVVLIVSVFHQKRNPLKWKKR
jgi:toxin ParE1/3/4